MVSVDYVMVNHKDLFCKHKHQPHASSWVPQATSLQKPSLARPYLAYNACSQQDRVMWLRKWNSTVPHKPGPLPHVEAAALSWIGRDRGAIAVLIEQMNSLKWPKGLEPIHHSGWQGLKGQWQQCRPHRGCPKKFKRNTAKTLLWLHTALHTSFNHNIKGLVQNNAMIECCGPRTRTAPIVHVRTAQ